MRVAVLVPFRDEPSQNRAAHVREFLKRVPGVLDAAAKRVGASEWRLFIGVQSQDGRKFSRGRVLNALFQSAVRGASPPFDMIVLHDVDLLPDEERALGYFTELPPGKALLCLNSTGEYAGMKHYIGGICSLRPATFQSVNGFPNALEGWGGEDDALRDRIGVAALASYPSGTVLNLETHADFARPEHVRARNNPAVKMRKEDRVRVRDAWKAGLPSAEGLEQLPFEARVVTFEDAACSETAAAAAIALADPRVSVLHCTVYMTAPTGWVVRMSASKRRTYYFNPTTGATAWSMPACASVAP